jgi:hypothetical protein
VSQTLLWVVNACRGEVAVELAGDVALETAPDSTLAESFGGPAGEVVAGTGVVPDAGVRDRVKGAVELAIAGAVEPVFVAVA